MSQLNDFIKGGALTADLSHGNKLHSVRGLLSPAAGFLGIVE